MEFLFSALPLLSVLLVPVVLSMSVSKKERLKKERLANLRMYDESLSYAVHVTHQFRTPRFKYAPASLPDYGTVGQNEKKERSSVFAEYQGGLPKRAVKSRLFRVIRM